jgi:transposase-like protein
MVKRKKYSEEFKKDAVRLDYQAVLAPPRRPLN